MKTANDLEELPNVGPELARELRAAGVQTADQLRRLGAKAAWAKLRNVNSERDCASSLLALEGAIRGVRWMSIRQADRTALSAYAAERRRR